MNHLKLQSSGSAPVTVLSNIFIDRYMPQANGEFVKVYIYLLRLLGECPRDLSTELMADRLGCTEGDICRALKYWSTRQLLNLELDSSGQLAGITLTGPDAGLSSGDGQPASTEPQTQLQVQPQPQVQPQSQVQPQTKPPASRGAAAGFSQLTPARVKELKENEEVAQLLYISEQYLGKALTPTETRKILFFYDELHMSVDLIDFLLQYCVGRGHKSMRYIETVAIAWADEGLHTVEMVKQATSRYGKDYFLILKAMGITNRSPVDSEIAFMDTWLKEYGSSMELIQEACSRTILQTGQPSFQYADKILSEWHQKNVSTLDDVHILDTKHQKRSQSSAKSHGTSSRTPNRFNNFQQREYDYKELEKQLLGRQNMPSDK